MKTVCRKCGGTMLMWAGHNSGEPPVLRCASCGATGGKAPTGSVPTHPKRFCRDCSHDIWQHGPEGCRKQGCDCRLPPEKT